MADFIENVIQGRRSTRQFDTSKEIPDEDVRKIVEAGMYAPSAVNSQPWHFIVIRDKAMLAKIHEVYPYTSFVKTSSVTIIVCAEPALEKVSGYWVQDCSAATENMLLTAHALGYGGTWCGVYPQEERIPPLRKLLGIPENIIPLNVVPIGVPAKVIPKPERFREDRIHMNKW